MDQERASALWIQVWAYGLSNDTDYLIIFLFIFSLVINF